MCSSDLKEESNASRFVAQKRSAGDASLEDVENRVAKLRKATSGTVVEEVGDDEIDIDDLDDEGDPEPPVKNAVENLSVKSLPSAVFGGLLNEAKQ